MQRPDVEDGGSVEVGGVRCPAQQMRQKILETMVILSDLGNQFDKHIAKGVPVELGIPPGALWRAGTASAIRFKAPSYKCAIPGAEQRFDLKNQLICLFGLAAGLLNLYNFDIG